MYRYVVSILLLVLVLANGGVIASAVDGEGAFVVVIDPGHGGRDIGAPGRITNESKVVYSVSKRLKSLINKHYPEVKVILTHNNDKYLKLYERGEIANNAKADIFISIHTNSLGKKNKSRRTINGSEVYTLGLEKTEASLSVMQRENAVFELDSDSVGTYQDYDPESIESQIIFEMYQNLNQHRSVELAENIQKELVGTAGRADRGVRQANLGVLRSISMPGVLVELDFICNPTVEKILASKDGQDMFARAIFNGFAQYYVHHGGHAVRIAEATTASDAQITYSIQILTSPTKLSSKDKKLKKARDVDFYIHDGLYKYICGSHSSFEDAEKQLKKIRKNYPEAFIIKMRNGKRVMQ